MELVDRLIPIHNIAQGYTNIQVELIYRWRLEQVRLYIYIYDHIYIYITYYYTSIHYQFEYTSYCNKANVYNIKITLHVSINLTYIISSNFIFLSSSIGFKIIKATLKYTTLYFVFIPHYACHKKCFFSVTNIFIIIKECYSVTYICLHI